MILHFAPQTCARVALTALEEVGAPFETRLVAFLAGEHRKPGYLAINPAGKVPALETPDGIVVQNVAILSYLAEKFPAAGLLPRREDAAGRADLLAHLLRCSSDLHPLVTRYVMAAMISSEPGHAPQIRAAAGDALRFQLAAVERLLRKQEWMLPEGWSIVDAYIAWIWFRITGAGFATCDLEALAAHYEQARVRPSAQRALAQEERAQQDLAARGLQFRPPPVAEA